MYASLSLELFMHPLLVLFYMAKHFRNARKILKVAFMTFEVKDTKNIALLFSVFSSSLVPSSNFSTIPITYMLYSKVIEGTPALAL